MTYSHAAISRESLGELLDVAMAAEALKIKMGC